MRKGWCAFLVALVAGGCKDDPKPTRVEDPSRLVQPTAPRKRPEPGPFRHPDREDPGPRGGEQLASDALAKALTQSREHAAAGRAIQAITALTPCANKQPQSVECEAELAILLANAPKRRAFARYYIDQAATVDDPSASEDLYRRLARAAMSIARYDAAAAAMGIVINRGKPSGLDYAARAKALQSDPKRLEEAIDALRRAAELDDSHPDWLKDRATLLVQAGDRDQAIETLKKYKVLVPERAPEVEGWIKQLSAQVKREREQEAALRGGRKKGGKKKVGEKKGSQ